LHEGRDVAFDEHAVAVVRAARVRRAVAVDILVGPRTAARDAGEFGAQNVALAGWKPQVALLPWLGSGATQHEIRRTLAGRPDARLAQSQVEPVIRAGSRIIGDAPKRGREHARPESVDAVAVRLETQVIADAAGNRLTARLQRRARRAEEKPSQGVEPIVSATIVRVFALEGSRRPRHEVAPARAAADGDEPFDETVTDLDMHRAVRGKVVHEQCIAARRTDRRALDGDFNPRGAVLLFARRSSRIDHDRAAGGAARIAAVRRIGADIAVTDRGTDAIADTARSDDDAVAELLEVFRWRRLDDTQVAQPRAVAQQHEVTDEGVGGTDRCRVGPGEVEQGVVCRRCVRSSVRRVLCWRRIRGIMRCTADQRHAVRHLHGLRDDVFAGPQSDHVAARCGRQCGDERIGRADQRVGRERRLRCETEEGKGQHGRAWCGLERRRQPRRSTGCRPRAGRTAVVPLHMRPPMGVGWYGIPVVSGIAVRQSSLKGVPRHEWTGKLRTPTGWGRSDSILRVVA
jgi:hypothetical protein